MSFGAAFYRGSDCCLLVLDVTNEQSFKSLDTWKKEFLNGASVTNPNEFPFVVLVNKMDEDPSKHVVPIQAVKEWCENNGGIPCYETSAKTGAQVDTAFLDVATKVVQSMKEVSSKFVTGQGKRLTHTAHQQGPSTLNQTIQKSRKRDAAKLIQLSIVI